MKITTLRKISCCLVLIISTVFLNHANAQKYYFEAHQKLESYENALDPYGNFSKQSRTLQSFIIDFDKKKIINNKENTEVAISEIEKNANGKETEYIFKTILFELPFTVTFTRKEDKPQEYLDTLYFEHIEISEEHKMPIVYMVSAYQGKSEKQ